MARGPYQGTFIPNIRPTVVLAPDAIVYINGEQEVIGCPQCSRTFDFNKYITSITVDLSIDSVPGSASISLAVPRHTIDDFYFDGNPIISPMMEIEIYAKGYFLVEGIPQYYPIFWGLITEVTDNYSSGETTVSIHANDILKWWDICKMNINPAWTAASGQEGRDLVKGNVYAGTNPYDVIFSLSRQSFGDIIVGTGSLLNTVRDAPQKAEFDAALSDMMFYWNKRFARMRSNLVLYGTSGVAVRGDTLYQLYSKVSASDRKSVASTTIMNANGGSDGGQMVFDPASHSVSAQKVVLGNAGQVDLWQSEYQTKLELANASKDAIGFEFYMDVTGDIVFKPPFYNLDVMGNKPTSWVQDVDIIDWDFSESESEVVTQIVLQGSYGGTVDYGVPADLSPYQTVVDYHLLRKYGWRSQNLNSEFLQRPELLYYHGLDLLDRINSRRHRASITIPMRPELRLGFPVYVAPKDQIWYLTGISHNIQFGGRATTGLTLTAKRAKFIAPRGMGTLKLKDFKGKKNADKDNAPSTTRYSSRELSKGGVFEINTLDAASIPAAADAFTNKPGATNPYEPLILRHPKTGRIVGYPNVVMAYTRPFAPADVSPEAGQKENEDDRVSKAMQDKLKERLDQANKEALSGNVANRESATVDKYLTNRYQYGLNSAGVYIYAHDVSPGGGVIKEILTLPSANVTVIPEDGVLKSLRGKTSLIRPVSDERGFEVIGHYQYGRRVSLRDGRLVINDANAEKSHVDVQLSLTGGLQETLTAQSQGLTTVVTGYQNPAKTLTELTPEERQTAAVLNPATGKPEFVDVGDNFVDSAPLGSQEQKGVIVETEASQLSRALTLTEMSVKTQTYNKENCVCLIGRQDLSFINSGYQIKPLSGTATDDTSVLSESNTGQSVTTGALNAANKKRWDSRVAYSDANLRLASLELDAREDPENVAKRQAVLEQQGVCSTLEAQTESDDKAFDTVASQYMSDNFVIPSNGQNLVAKVDQFLVDLYKKLDGYHQEYEKAIKGDLLPMTPRNVSGLTGEKLNPPSKLAPPFSAPNRYQLGDPNATVGAIESNTENLSKSWDDFGNNLRKNSENTKLSKQISTDQASIARLTATRDRLVQQQKSSAVVIGIDIQKSISHIDKQIAKLQKQVAELQKQVGIRDFHDV